MDVTEAQAELQGRIAALRSKRAMHLRLERNELENASSSAREAAECEALADQFQAILDVVQPSDSVSA